MKSTRRESSGQLAMAAKYNEMGPMSAVSSKLSKLLGDLGFATVDLGTLAAGARLQRFPGGSLPTLNLIKLP